MSDMHETRPVKVWADIDIGVADLVEYLNTIPGVRTHASCQGTIGEGGPAPYRAQVMCSWNSEAFKRLEAEFDISFPDDCNKSWGYVHPREQASRGDQRAGQQPSAEAMPLGYCDVEMMGTPHVRDEACVNWRPVAVPTVSEWKIRLNRETAAKFLRSLPLTLISRARMKELEDELSGVFASEHETAYKTGLDAAFDEVVKHFPYMGGVCMCGFQIADGKENVDVLWQRHIQTLRATSEPEAPEPLTQEETDAVFGPAPPEER